MSRPVGQSVLVIEDEPFQQLLVQRLLETVGASRVHTCSDGASALAYLDQHQVDAILCDLNMPNMDGVMLIKALREHAPEAALVLMSSASEKVLHSTQLLGQKYGSAFVGSLAKPIHEDTLRAVLLRAAACAERSARSPATPQIALPSLAVLERALDEKRFVARYEPKIAAVSGSVVSAEALTRLSDGEGGWLFPHTFISSMEDSGLIDRLTQLVIEHVLGDMVQMQASGFAPTISINLSAGSLKQPHFADSVFEAVDRHRLAPSSVSFEITETVRASDSPVALENLIRLHLHGHALSIDDFGTGYSSIQRLSEIPFSELKIDREFVHQTMHRDEMRTVVESSVALAQKLGLNTCAEGIETVEQLDYLLGLGINLCQGWLFSQAVDIQGLGALVRQYRDGTAFTALRSSLPG